MEYKIGEVSKMLNISKEMIRYYEKKGALSPSRVQDNNYRTYSSMDVFLLMEIKRYQALGISVKEITNLFSDNYMQQYASYLHQYHYQLSNDIQHKMLMQERVKELAERALTSQVNMNLYWFKLIPEHQLLFLCDSHGDDYEKIKYILSTKFENNFAANKIIEKVKELYNNNK